MKDLADRGEMGIQSAQSRMPVGPELPAHVRKRVDAKAVQSGYFRPPDAVLQKILLDRRIFGVHVRQNSEEPAFREISFHPRRGVGIDQRFERIVPSSLTAHLSITTAVKRRKRVNVMIQRSVNP